MTRQREIARRGALAAALTGAVEHLVDPNQGGLLRSTSAAIPSSSA
ncbi:hypothetical protein [Actinoalloteichus sp. GBA129-24]|nr:hypothetical protein [Actinoalloteichus sp. GBA129-24]